MKLRPKDNIEKYESFTDTKEAVNAEKLAKVAAKAAWLKKLELMSDEDLPF